MDAGILSHHASNSNSNLVAKHHKKLTHFIHSSSNMADETVVNGVNGATEAPPETEAQVIIAEETPFSWL